MLIVLAFIMLMRKSPKTGFEDYYRKNPRREEKSTTTSSARSHTSSSPSGRWDSQEASPYYRRNSQGNFNDPRQRKIAIGLVALALFAVLLSFFTDSPDGLLLILLLLITLPVILRYNRMQRENQRRRDSDRGDSSSSF